MNNLDGKKDDTVYNAPEDTKELDESFMRELFQSGSESDFKVSSFEKHQT